MVDAKSIVSIAISIVVLAFVIDNIPTIKNNVGDVLSGVSLSSITTGAKSQSSFPVKLDAGLLTSSFGMVFEDVESIKANSDNASILFDDRLISINPSLLEDMTIQSYSGKLSYYPGEKLTSFDGSAKGIISDSVTIKSERKVRILGNLTSATTKLTNVVGATITLSKASGTLLYNTTNSVSLLGDEVKITKFNGEISIGSYGITLQGNAGRIDVKGGGKTITYG
ncbi:MAG: hypothetical protein HY515_04530 [Candidatus Aenigmarchaeota archaeon]|nr:hypothetical protein [Candidatus Aenigmarchaeota archaeon]